ncbi:phage scaffolding protein [Paenibacillus sp. sgz302251]|uniref:phage scaffolding protein n=1 Tax=Paenibacillus sp. sgz302251 TaxID=3414493 RepID=UPI003C7AD2ED
MDLKELLGDDLFSQVSEKLGDKKVAIVSDGQWIPKAKFDSLNDEKKTYIEQNKALNTQLDEMKTKVTGNEQLTKQVEALQAQLKDSDIKIKDVKINSAIESALIKASAKFPDLLTGKFDKSKLEIKEDGTISGIDDQLKAITETYKDLFGETKIVGGDPNNGGNPNPNPDTSKLSDDEFFAQALKTN